MDKDTAIFHAITNADNIVLVKAIKNGKEVSVIAIVGEDDAIYPLAVILNKEEAEHLKPLPEEFTPEE